MDTKKSTMTPPIPFRFGNHPQNCTCPTCTRILNSLRSKPYVQALEAALTSEQGGARRIADLEARVLSLTGQLQQSQDGAGVLQRTLEESRRHNQELEKRFTTKTNEARRWAEKAEALAGEKQTLGVQVISLTQQLTNMTQERDVQLAAKLDADGKIGKLLEILPEASYSTLVDYIVLRLGSQEESLARSDSALARAVQEISELESRARRAEIREVTLERQVRDLTPVIPAWAQWLAVLFLVFGVALVAQQSGFEAGRELGSSAGQGVAR